VFCRLDELGLVAVGQWIGRCSNAASRRRAHGVGTVAVKRCLAERTRGVSHEPFGHRPTKLLGRVRRYMCPGCGRSWCEDLSATAPVRAKLSRGGMRWALEALVLDHLTWTRIAAGLGVSWHTANDAVLAEGTGMSTDDPARLDGVRALGVGEYVWRHPLNGAATSP